MAVFISPLPNRDREGAGQQLVELVLIVLMAVSISPSGHIPLSKKNPRPRQKIFGGIRRRMAKALSDLSSTGYQPRHADWD